MDRLKKTVHSTLLAANRFMNPDRLSYIELSWQTGVLKLGSDRPNSQWVELAYQTFADRSAEGVQSMQLEITTQAELEKVLQYLNELEKGGHTTLVTERGFVRQNVSEWSKTLKTREQQKQDVIEYRAHMNTVLGKNK